MPVEASAVFFFLFYAKKITNEASSIFSWMLFFLEIYSLCPLFAILFAYK